MALISPLIGGGEAVTLLAGDGHCDLTTAWEVLRDAYQEGKLDSRARGREAAREQFEKDRGFWTAADEHAWLSHCRGASVTDQFLKFLDATREFRRGDVLALAHRQSDGATEEAAGAALAAPGVVGDSLMQALPTRALIGQGSDSSCQQELEELARRRLARVELAGSAKGRASDRGGTVEADTAASAPELRKAINSMIHETISAIYDHAKAQRMIPPNLHDIAKHVLPRLERQGVTTTKTRIQELAGDQRYDGQRRKPGPRVYGSLLPFSDLEM